MAIDPVESIRAIPIAAPLDLDPRPRLATIAALPPSTVAPYVTLTANRRPSGDAPGARRVSPELEVAIDETLARYPLHTAAGSSVASDLARVRQVLERELPPEIAGVYLTACSLTGAFEVVPMPIQLLDQLTAGPVPALSVLAQAIEDREPYAVLALDQQRAMLTLAGLAGGDGGIEIRSTLFPAHQKQGGWSQARYQRRADERVDAFLRVVASEIRRLIDDEAIRRLVVLGTREIRSEFRGLAHSDLVGRIVAESTIEADALENEPAVLLAAEPLIEQVERGEELATAERVRDAVNAGGRGAAGVNDVLAALQAGQVRTLVMNADFSATGWADFTLGVSGAGFPPSLHPTGGDAREIVPVALEDQLIRLALATGATLEFIATTDTLTGATAEVGAATGELARLPAAVVLDALGGVAALLRFTLGDDQPVAAL